MAKVLQYVDDINDAKLDAIEVTIGTAPVIRFYTGAIPANNAATRTGTKIAEGTLPSNWMADAATHVKSLLGTWTLTGTNGGGTAGYFSIFDGAVTKSYIQGNIGLTGSTSALELDNTNIADAQNITVTQFDITAGNIG